MGTKHCCSFPRGRPFAHSETHHPLSWEAQAHPSRFTCPLRSAPKPQATTPDIQELAVGLRARIEFALGLFPGQAAVVPGHPLMSCGGDELLHLGRLADDGLLQGLTLGKEGSRTLISDLKCAATGTLFNLLGPPHSPYP